MLNDLKQPAKNWLADAIENLGGLLDSGEDPSFTVGVLGAEIEIRLNSLPGYFERGCAKVATADLAVKQAKYLEVEADVRYWEDARVGGCEDVKGDLIPCRKGDAWAPVICLEDGRILGWPESAEADIHYKVCDAGEYWLQDASRNRIAKWRGFYVPDLLCVGDNGHGDYIILKVGSDGKVKGWSAPRLNEDEWVFAPEKDAE